MSGPASLLPFVERRDHTPAVPLSTNQLSTTKSAARHRFFPLITSPTNARGINTGKISGLRIQHAMPAQIAALRQHAQQARRRGRVIDAIHSARHRSHPRSCRLVVQHGCPTARPPSRTNDRPPRQQNFPFRSRIDGRKEHPANLPELAFGVTNPRLHQAAVAEADTYAFIGKAAKPASPSSNSAAHQ